jgi:hypothetical protein
VEQGSVNATDIDWKSEPAADHWCAMGDGTAWWLFEAPPRIDVTTWADVKAGRPRQEIPVGGPGRTPAPLFSAYPTEKLIFSRPK